MRGKRVRCHPARRTTRNIPAYAGKTVVGASPQGGRQEHPRVCGENGVIEAFLGDQHGTSPRMRGKLNAVRYHNQGLRNIPAYAGKTVRVLGPKGRSAEHPRVCGENHWATFIELLEQGTSPRMRGKPTIAHVRQSCTRNIPAYAGKTSTRSMRRLPP